MRKIVAEPLVSPDGVAESPETRHFPALNEEVSAAVMAIQAEAHALLLDRVTDESRAEVWPH
ncbi:hypothetical protein AB0B45_25965 [Nonomuraea sp. NPDC049152]|uniref:hypothetical protein n=1 Tax=Nonomuraea sp. NPDC049152 TaxID=3154350 RepID=UPI0034049019